MGQDWIKRYVDDLRKESRTATLANNSYLAYGHDNFNWTSHWTGDRIDGQFWMRFVWRNLPAYLEHLDTKRKAAMTEVTFERLYEVTRSDYDVITLFLSAMMHKVHSCFLLPARARARKPSSMLARRA